MFKTGDKVQLSEAARRQFLAGGDRGPHIEAARQDLTATVIGQLGQRHRHLVIGYLVDFGEVNMVAIEEHLKPV